MNERKEIIRELEKEGFQPVGKRHELPYVYPDDKTHVYEERGAERICFEIESWDKENKVLVLVTEEESQKCWKGEVTREEDIFWIEEMIDEILLAV